ncbi:hypothetical protein RB195_006512 [Necator americanus]|uniref:Uncharacterized protein n=1 Tax=Necator americanus TaxID=51031 RepID=A0ABR1BT06_NECAM
MTRGRHQHVAPPSKMAKVNRLRFFGHILRRPADRLLQRVQRSSSGSSWKKPPGRKRKFWTEVVKEDLRALGVDRQLRRDVMFCRTWNSGEWIDSVQGLAEDREGRAELCSRTAHFGEDAGNLLASGDDIADRRLSQSNMKDAISAIPTAGVLGAGEQDQIEVVVTKFNNNDGKIEISYAFVDESMEQFNKNVLSTLQRRTHRLDVIFR